MYIFNQYSLKQQTHWPSLCNWQGPNYTPVINSGWVNTTGGDTERFFYSSPIREQPGPAVLGESHCQICRFLSTGHKPHVLGQCQALYLTFPLTLNCCLCPNCYHNNYEWNLVQNGGGIFLLTRYWKNPILCHNSE